MKRYSSIDAMKAIAAFLVVSIHLPFPGAFGTGVVSLARIAVPFFFISSGYFLWSNNRGVLSSKIKKHMKSMLILVISTNILYLCWDMFMIKFPLPGGSVSKYLQGVITIKNLFNFLFLNNSPFSGHLWYLSAYLYVLIIYYFINRYNLYRISFYIVPLLLLTNIILGKYSVALLNFMLPSEFILRNFMFVGIPYFLLGNMIRNKMESNDSKIINNKILISGIVIFSLTSILENYVLKINNINASGGDIFFSTTLLVLCIFIYLAQNPNLFENNILVNIGKYYSLYIYTFHIVIGYIVSYIALKMLGIKESMFFWVAVFIVYFICIVCSIIYIKMKQLITIKRNTLKVKNYSSH